MANRFLSNITINDSYTLPSADGTQGQVITTDGSGNLSFSTVSVDRADSNFIYYNVKNSSGSTINKGTAVMATGTDGNSGHILIAPMIADGTVEPKFFIGVLESTLGNGDIGRAIHFGELDQFNTNAFQDGDVLWCDPANDGGFTTTEPLGPNLKIAAAIVINAATNGKIKVRVQGNSSLNDIHDVKLVSKANGDLLQWNNTTGVWENKTLGQIADTRYVNVSGDTMTGNLTVQAGGTSSRITLDPTQNTSSYALTIGVTNDGIKFSHNSNSRGFVFDRNGANILTLNANTTANFASTVTASSFVKSGGTSSQFLKADGSVDSNTYALSGHNHDASYVNVSGDTMTGDLMFNDGIQARFGNGNDLNIYHSGLHSYIRDSGEGNLYIAGSNLVWIGTGDLQETSAIFNTNGSVELRYDNSIKFETTSTGIEVNGNISMSDSYAIKWGNNYLTGLDSVDALRLFTAGSEKIRIDASGNVGIGTTSPSEKLEVAGNIKANAFGSEGSTYTRVYSPQGATYNGSASTTGMLTVILPQIGLNTMLKMTIRVFDYAQDESFDVQVAGYLYGNPETYWTNTSAYILASPQKDRNFTVRFGYNSVGKGCVFIGETGSTWSYVKFGVVEAQFSHSQVSLENWIDGWATTILSDTTGYTFYITESDTQATNWKRNGQNLYYGSGTGNVGIGTTTPIDLLNVNKENDKSRIVISRGGTNLSPSTSIGALEYYADYDGSPIQYATIEAYANALSGVRSSLDFKVKSTSGNILTGMTVYGTSSGVNVGIGTITPATKLHVAGGDIYTDSQFRLNQGQGITWNNGDNYIKGISGYHLQFTTYDGASAQQEVLRLTGGSAASGGGRVGIGTTSPSTKLYVNGVIRTPNQIDVHPTSGAFRFFDGTTFNSGIGGQAWSSVGGTNDTTFYLNSGNFHISNTTSPFATFDKANERVGIGTTTPAFKLDVNGEALFRDTIGVNGEGNGITVDSGYDNNGRVGLMKYPGYEGMLTAGDETVLRLGHRTDNNRVATSGTPTLQVDMEIATNGAVSIYNGSLNLGTDSVSSAINSIGDLFIFNVDSNNNTGGTPNFRFRIGSTTDISTINNTGIYLHGNSKYFTATETTNGYEAVQLGTDSSGDGNFVLRSSNNNVRIKLYAEQGAYNYIDNGGNFGIGYTTPSYKLDVNGVARANRFISDTSSTGPQMALSYEDQNKKIFNIQRAFTFTGQGVYYFNLAFGSQGGFGFDVTMVTARNGNYKNFGMIKDSGYMYWESDGDFVQHVQGESSISSTYSGGIYLDALPTTFGANNTTDTSAGTLNYSYYIKRYAIYLPDNTTGADGFFKVTVETYGYQGDSIYFLNA
jgi:hypothetical protein